jgi:hypothetical protein
MKPSELHEALLGMAKLAPRLELPPQLAGQLQEFSQKWSGRMANMEQALKKLNPILTDLAGFYTTATTNFTAQLAAAGETIDRFREQFGAWYDTEAVPGSRALARYGWFLSPSMPLPFAVNVTRLACSQSVTGGQLTELFIGYVASNGWSNAAAQVQVWGNQGLLHGRVHILRACVETLQSTTPQSGALAVLPALIAQIDGALSELALNMGLARNGQHWVDDASERQRRDEWLAARLKDPLFHEPAMDLVLHVLFRRATPGEPNLSPLMLNRHKILHGECTDYGTVENVARALLVLDFLSGIGPYTVEKIKGLRGTHD